MKFYETRNQRAIFNEDYKTLFQVEDEDCRVINNVDLAELKMSVRIAKFNLNLDVKNSYYLQQLGKAEILLKEKLEKLKIIS
jgi:hypothetical protein